MDISIRTTNYYYNPKEFYIYVYIPLITIFIYIFYFIVENVVLVEYIVKSRLQAIYILTTFSATFLLKR